MYKPSFILCISKLHAQTKFFNWINSLWKETRGQNFATVFMAYFCWFYGEEPCTKFCGVLVRFHKVVMQQNFELMSHSYPRMYKTFQNISLVFIVFLLLVLYRKSLLYSFMVFSDHFSRTYEVAKFWVIKLYLDVSDVIHVTEHTRC